MFVQPADAIAQLENINQGSDQALRWFAVVALISGALEEPTNRNQ